MPYPFLDLAITPSVRATQEAMGAAHLWENFEGERKFDRFDGDAAAFISERDSFYMASVSETGWPYVQHRGGPPGFLKVMDEQTLAFADYRGNRQYISTGNLAANDKACLFLMDYPRRARLKILVRVETLALEAEPDLVAALLSPTYPASPERVFRLSLEAYDWNCSQHIIPRFCQSEINDAVRPLLLRMAELEAENAALRSGR